MALNRETLLTLEEAAADFERLERIVTQHGSAVLTKEGRPHLVVLPFDRAQQHEEPQVIPDELFDQLSQQVMDQYAEALRALAEGRPCLEKDKTDE